MIVKSDHVGNVFFSIKKHPIRSGAIVCHPVIQAKSLRVQFAFGYGSQLVECRFIVYSQISQHFAVHFHASHFQAVHQLAVGQAVQAGLRIDPGNPQFAEIAFLLTTIAIRIQQRFHYLCVCRFKQTVFGTEIAFRKLQYFLVTTACYDATFYSWHNKFLLISCVAVL